MEAKVLTVVGARPQFIKAAMVSREIERTDGIGQVLVHTGQHYDYGMSGLFFDELGIPAPDRNLGVSGGTHAEMTARMLPLLERVMVDEAPGCVLVYGDTNSTLAAALAAAKLNIPVVHAEAGFRTHRLTNPEELNRVCTDHISSLLFAPVPAAMEELEREGLADRAVFTGDLMYDAYMLFSGGLDRGRLRFVELGGGEAELPDEWVYLTCHRQENDDPGVLVEVIDAAGSLDLPVVFPVHPRVRGAIERIASERGYGNVLLLEPVGYLESLFLLNGARAVVTDSGGLQREAFFAGKKCATLLPFPSADETLAGNRNTLVDPVTRDGILAALDISQEVNPKYTPFGDGHAARKMVGAMIDFMGGR